MDTQPVPVTDFEHTQAPRVPHPYIPLTLKCHLPVSCNLINQVLQKQTFLVTPSPLKANGDSISDSDLIKRVWYWQQRLKNNFLQQGSVVFWFKFWNIHKVSHFNSILNFYAVRFAKSTVLICVKSPWTRITLQEVQQVRTGFFWGEGSTDNSDCVARDLTIVVCEKIYFET